MSPAASRIHSIKAKTLVTYREPLLIDLDSRCSRGSRFGDRSYGRKEFRFPTSCNLPLTPWRYRPRVEPVQFPKDCLCRHFHLVLNPGRKREHFGRVPAASRIHSIKAKTLVTYREPLLIDLDSRCSRGSRFGDRSYGRKEFRFPTSCNLPLTPWRYRPRVEPVPFPEDFLCRHFYLVLNPGRKREHFGRVPAASRIHSIKANTSVTFGGQVPWGIGSLTLSVL